MQASAGLIRVIIEFASGVERREDYSLRAHAFFMHADRYSSPVVLNSAGTVSLERDFNCRTESREMLIHGIVHDLIDQMVKTPCRHASDVHSGSCADGLQPFEDLDARRVVIISVLMNRCHLVSFLSIYPAL